MLLIMHKPHLHVDVHACKLVDVCVWGGGGGLGGACMHTCMRVCVRVCVGNTYSNCN